MSDFLKKTERIRSMLSGIELDLKKMSKNSSSLIDHKQVQKSLSAVDEEINSLNSAGHLDLITDLDHEERNRSVKDLQSKFQSLKQEFLNRQQAPTLKESQNYALEEILGTTLRLKGYCGQMSDELEDHNLLLSNLDNDIDKNATQFERIQDNFESMLSKTSDSCLMWAILLLGIVLIVILLYF